MDKKLTLSRQLKKFIAESGYSEYRLAKLSGVHASALGRFTNGERSLGLESVEQLAEVLSFEFIQKIPRQPKDNSEGKRPPARSSKIDPKLNRGGL